MTIKKSRQTANNDSIETVRQEPLFIAWADGDKSTEKRAMESFTKGMNRSFPISKASNIYRNVGPGSTSIRDGFSKTDYDWYRKEEEDPGSIKDLIRQCEYFYEEDPILHNIINLMADFVVQGIDLHHPDEKVKVLAKRWWQEINGKDRSERFANLLFRGNVVCTRKTAEISKEKLKEFYKSAAGTNVLDDELEIAISKNVKPDMEWPEDILVGNKQIPYQYIFRDIQTIDNVADEFSTFLDGKPILAVNLPDEVIRTIKYPKTDDDHEKIKQLARMDKTIIQRVREGKTYLLMDPNKTIVAYYKKDDWKPWAAPMAACVLRELKMLRKMKLADLAALDGAISSIRVWKLGYLDKEPRILPTEAGIARFAEVITNAVAGGVVDVMWNPAIDLLETKTDLHNFLGMTKYTPTLNFIRIGLGIPSIMGSEGSKGGFTNNSMELKTLIERLQYARNILVRFWNTELQLLSKALSLKIPPTLTFDRNVLTDEATEIQIMKEMVDRDILSMETLQERLDTVPEVERDRITKEWELRKTGVLPPKASPFHNPQTKEEMEKIALQSGQSSPKDFGMKATGVPPAKKMPGPNGRPPGKKDTKPRKQKTVKPRTKSDIKAFVYNVAWAEQAQKKIAEILHPIYLRIVSKENMRQLTDEESTNVERLKFAYLLSLTPGSQITENSLRTSFAQPLEISELANTLLKSACEMYRQNHGELPIEKVRQLQSSTYALLSVSEEPGEDDEDDEDDYDITETL